MSPPHVAVVAFPVASHATVLLSLAHALAAAAPTATVSLLSTHDALVRLRKPSTATFPSNLRFVEIDDGLPPPPSTDGNGETAELPVPRRIELFMAAAENGGLKDGLDLAARDGRKVSCVVGDAFVWMAADVAAAAGVPWVAVWPSSASALLAHLYTDELRDEFRDHPASRGDELLTSYAGLGSYRVKDLPEGVVTGDMEFVVSLLVYRMAQRLRRGHAVAVAVNTFPGLDPPDVIAALAAVIPNSLPIGPFHLLPGVGNDKVNDDDAHGCLAWLDRHAPRTVAYVAFGTVATPPPDELIELALGLESTGAPFLWSLRKESWPHLPPGFLDRTTKGDTGLVVTWAPQVGVLRHEATGAFVTHGGWASAMEAACDGGGVPMACRPFFGDHGMNARRVAHVLGCGTVFEGRMTRGAVADAVVGMLRGEEGRRMRARAAEVKAKMAEALQHGGDGTSSFDELVKIVLAC
uniref:Glycosyltransferase n=1 Tax=Leersia perrieri TaxID=77586 RepID=A0A0D9WMU0_9ORYZ